MELVIVPFRRDDNGNDVVTFASQTGREMGLRGRAPVRASERQRASGNNGLRRPGNAMNVAIVGIGIHPFGRHDGVSGRQQGVRRGPRSRSPTPASAGATCSSPSAAVETVATPTPSSPTSGSPGSPFVNVSNGCATGGSALTMADSTIRSGAYDLGVAIGFDKHPPGAFNVDPERTGSATGTARPA